MLKGYSEKLQFYVALRQYPKFGVFKNTPFGVKIQNLGCSKMPLLGQILKFGVVIIRYKCLD